MITNEEEAMEILREIEERAGIAWEKRSEIDISKPLQKTFVGALDVYKYLPKTMAFAVKLLNGEKDITDCKPLFEGKAYTGIRENLVSLILSTGYELEL